MNTLNLNDIIMERQILSNVNLYNHKNDTIRKYFHNSMLSNTSYCLKNVNKFIDKFNITLYELFNTTRGKIKSLIRRSYPPMDWRSAMIEELLNAKDGITDLGLTVEEIDAILVNISYDPN